MSSKMSLITVLPTTQIIHQTERSKKSRKVNHNATTSFFVNTQQQQQNCLFFNNHPKNDLMKYSYEIRQAIILNHLISIFQ